MGIFFSFVIGSVFGSFFAMVIDRLPQGLSLLFPGSHCGNCERSLHSWELIPIVSFLALAGRCRLCGEKIPKFCLYTELLTGLLFVAAWSGILDWPVFLLLIMSLILSIIDSQIHAFPFVIWLFFALVLVVSLPFQPLNLVWLLLALLATGLDIKIGAGDFLWLYTASFSLSFIQIVLVLQLASLAGLGFCFLKKAKFKSKLKQELPFIPFLSLAYLAVLLLGQIQ